MGFVDRVSWIASLLAAGCMLLVDPGRPVWAQAQLAGPGFGSFPGPRYELAGAVRVDQADTTVQTYLDRVDEYLADGQQNEAIETLREVMEEYGLQLIGVTPRRYISLRDYCHLQFASLPPEPLALYRSHVDPVARRWYEQGIAANDRPSLVKVIDEAFASSWGDDALFLLGEMALETGDYGAARAYWERAIPVDPPADAARTWLSVPDTNLDLAAIRARLVLVSILEGSSSRASEELTQLARLHPDARGAFGGREVKYVEALAALLDESSSWPAPAPSGDWPTFAGSPLRDKVASAPIDVAQIAWRIPLRPSIPAHPSIWGSGSPSRRVAEDARSPLSYHPLVVGDLVLTNSQTEILAVDLDTGRPAWGEGGPEIYRDPFDAAVHARYNPPDNLGVPRFTMTALEGKLYARMGSAVTSRPRDPQSIHESGYLVCLDLEAEGRLRWKILPEEPGLSFEGSPLSDGRNVYVAMRRSDIQPEAHVACFEAANGRLRWQTFVCAAETAARGMLHETTQNLLTLHRDTIYLNTNLGAVAALSARDGRVRWISLYPRQRKGDLIEPAPHTCRDLNPGLYDRGNLLVAPADSRRIFALDAVTGQILWQTGPEVEDAVHLLGVFRDALIAGGDKLYWIGLEPEQAGKVLHVWPHGHEKLGYGRGVLAGDCVLWPTREKIHLFDAATGQQKKAVSLVARGVTGGNLLVAPGYLLIAKSDELLAFHQAASPHNLREEKIACSNKTTFKPYRN